MTSVSGQLSLLPSVGR